MAREYPALLDLVGGTPIVRLDKLGQDVEPTLLAKLEHLNPGGAVKNRIGPPMIEAAERDGGLKAGGADRGAHPRQPRGGPPLPPPHKGDTRSLTTSGRRGQ